MRRLEEVRAGFDTGPAELKDQSAGRVDPEASSNSRHKKHGECANEQDHHMRAIPEFCLYRLDSRHIRAAAAVGSEMRMVSSWAEEAR